MGIYNDFRSSTKREGWVYTYLGSELLEAAKKKQAHYASKERHARETLGNLYKDSTVSSQDESEFTFLITCIDDLKKEVDTLGNLHEQCDVFVHEFTRSPDREFHLSLGDVTFFDLHLPTSTE